MTAEQFEKMSPLWIKRTIGIDLVSSAGETFAGPRFQEVSRNGMVLEYACGPWWFPRNLVITHLNWVDTKPSAAPRPSGVPDLNADSLLASPRRVWRSIGDRLVGGLILAMPILITFWVIHWLYSILAEKVIDPLALLVLWKF